MLWNGLKRLFRPPPEPAADPSPVPSLGLNPYDVLVFPIVEWDFLFQRPQHLSLELSRRGHRVFYFSTRFTPEHYVHDIEAEEVAPSVFVVELPGSIRTPDIYRDIPTETQIASIETGIARLREIYEIGATLSIVDYPFWGPIARGLPNNIVLYDCMDDYASFANSGRPAREMETEIAREADILVCSSSHLHEKLLRSAGREALLIRNGVEADHYATPPPQLAIEPNGRTAGYWGATGEWTDIELLAHAARSLPDVRFVLLGQVQRVDVSSLAALPNVDLRGPVAYQQLPAYAHAFDVCLLPYRVCDYALASDPMKVWEYLSAGKPVVAVRFPEIERFEAYLTLTSTPDEFVAGIRRALSGDEAGSAEARKALARENTWRSRTDALQSAVAPFFPKVSVIVLAHNEQAFTEACLDSLDRFSRYPDLEVIVVDNASTDSTPEFLARWAAGRTYAKWVRSGANTGFSSGNNLGAREASGDYLVFLNNDCYVTDGWVAGMLAHFRADANLGLLGPVTNRSGNESVIDISYADMEQMAVQARRYTRAHRGQRTRPGVLHWFCVMLPRRIWRELGELDEGFGLGMFEDDDYTLRVRAAGYEALCAEDVFIHHHHSASFGRLPKEEYDALFARNRQYFESKWGTWTPPVFRPEVQARCSR